MCGMHVGMCMHVAWGVCACVWHGVCVCMCVVCGGSEDADAFPRACARRRLRGGFWVGARNLSMRYRRENHLPLREQEGKGEQRDCGRREHNSIRPQGPQHQHRCPASPAEPCTKRPNQSSDQEAEPVGKGTPSALGTKSGA